LGNPANYSLELPERCLQLLDALWLHAQKTHQVARPELGPLTSTFLISMSMPIINLPIERIERREGGEDRHYADDRQKMDPAAVTAIVETLQKRPLREAPFFVKDVWRFACCKEAPFPNIAYGVPEPIADKLDHEKAAQDAADMPASQWCSVLRNALAHGGIAYLNAQGRSSRSFERQPVKMYAFVSGKYDQKSEQRPKPLIAVNFLRISEGDYYDFLRRWVVWLQETGIARASEAA
jgi:hypothetical protein